MLKNEKATKAIRDLITALADLSAQLNTQKKSCECCHLARFEDYEAFKLNEELMSLSERLIKVGNKLK